MKKLFMFPGQGSQFVGMGKSLVENFAIAKLTFEEGSDALGIDLKKLCFEGPESDLKLTALTQSVILTHSVASYRVVTSESELRPDYVAGHSLGEYSALVAADSLKYADAIRLVNRRGKFMQEAVPVGTGSMAALIGGTEEQVSILCKAAGEKTGKVCEMANFNGGGQIVISGHKEAIDEVVAQVAANPGSGIGKAVVLPVSAPFHCSLMKPAEDGMGPLLEDTLFGFLKTPYIANFDAEVHQDHQGVVPRLLKQICGSVRWAQSMEKLKGLEVTQAYEIGPGKVLSGLMRRIDKEVKCKGIDTMEDVKSLTALP